MTHSFDRKSWLKEGTLAMTSGMLYGATSILVGHPLDTIKTKMQAETGYAKGGGLFHVVRNVLKTHGFFSLYRGWLPPFWGSVIFRSLQFAVFEALYTKWEKTYLTNIIPGTGGIQLRVVCAGFVAATVRAFIECPIEYAKVCGQTHQKWKLNKIYTGFWVNWFRTGFLMTIYFCNIDTIRRKTNAFDSNLGRFLANGLSATMAFILIWPAEVLKNQVQAGLTESGSTTRERMNWIYKNHGPLGFFRGLLPGVMCVFLRNGSAMVVMQQAQKKFREWGFSQ
eukprot:TRINITY_DN96899_c0_g1_i1.p1 TRINITY_DN96899_c0_g1~~TRINITY_DN96899_c0_g1_i1.p1  ORF type:complete len:281 (+),score=5.73 TRINITY_DN96899_c0_g1_i1:75-917(+)